MSLNLRKALEQTLFFVDFSTLASEKSFMFVMVPLTGSCDIIGVPVSSSILKQDDSNPDIGSNPSGHSTLPIAQKNGFPMAHKELFHLNLSSKKSEY